MLTRSERNESSTNEEWPECERSFSWDLPQEEEVRSSDTPDKIRQEEHENTFFKSQKKSECSAEKNVAAPDPPALAHNPECTEEEKWRKNTEESVADCRTLEKNLQSDAVAERGERENESEDIRNLLRSCVVESDEERGVGRCEDEEKEKERQFMKTYREENEEQRVQKFCERV